MRRSEISLLRSHIRAITKPNPTTGPTIRAHQPMNLKEYCPTNALRPTARQSVNNSTRFIFSTAKAISSFHPPNSHSPAWEGIRKWKKALESLNLASQLISSFKRCFGRLVPNLYYDKLTANSNTLEDRNRRSSEHQIEPASQ